MDFFIIPDMSVLEWILLKKQKFDYNSSRAGIQPIQ